MQTVGVNCNICNKNIAFATDGIGCPTCNLEFHRSCILDGDICPECKEHIPDVDEHSGPLFFPVSKPKLMMMSICTFGIYEFYWLYKNFKFIKNTDNPDIRPFWRTMFFVFFCHSLFRVIIYKAKSLEIPCRYSAGWLAVAYIMLYGSWDLPGLYSTLSYLTFLPLFLIQEVVNNINSKLAPKADKNSTLTRKNFVCILFGGGIIILNALPGNILETKLAEILLGDIPDSINVENIEKNYGQDISKIKNALLNGIPLGEISLSNDVLEVFTTDSSDEWGDNLKAIYQKFNVTRGSYTRFIGNVGVGKIVLSGKTIECLIYEIENKGMIYWIYFRDSYTNKN